MARVSCIVYQFPQLSESYARTEFEALARAHELDIISLHAPDVRGSDEIPSSLCADVGELRERVRRFDPDVIHTHWLGLQLDAVVSVARDTTTPFTVRSHSFDVLWPRVPRKGWRRLFPPPDVSEDIQRNLGALQSELCLGVLCFPFAIPRLVRAGIPERKLVPVWPVIDYAAFHDESPNGRAIYNGGACLPKKDFVAYLKFAARIADREFNLFPIGHSHATLQSINRELGSPVTIREPVAHKDMPGLYKRHEWLLYTADPDIGTVGWPVSVAEAQAAGVGVLMPNLRPDIRDYVGPAGFVYDSFDQVREWIGRPYPDAMRRAGFEHAGRSDVNRQLSALTALWARGTT